MGFALALPPQHHPQLSNALYRRIEWKVPIEDLEYPLPNLHSSCSISATISPPSSIASLSSQQQQHQSTAQDRSQKLFWSPSDNSFVLRWAGGTSGTWTATVKSNPTCGVVRDHTVDIALVSGDNDGRGYAEVAPNNRYFQWSETGESLFLVGENICWSSDSEVVDRYNQWFEGLATRGHGNYARLWLNPSWNKFALEKAETGLGVYDEQAALYLDGVIEAAERLDIKLLFCFDSFNSLRASDPFPDWANNPYNSENGGPVDTIADFVHSQEASAAIKARNEYIISRWGYSSSVFAWELWNELDLTEGFWDDLDAWKDWHVDQARAIQEADGNRHMVTTSFCWSKGVERIDALPEMAYVQTHSYNPTDMADNAVYWQTEKAKAFNKPHVLGEFGIGSPTTAYEQDPTGIHLENSGYAALASGSAGVTMTWWWDSYIHPYNLYDIWTNHALLASSSNIDWASVASWDTAPTRLRGAKWFGPKLMATGIIGDQSVVVAWVQSKDYVYNNDKEPSEIVGVELVIKGLPASSDWEVCTLSAESDTPTPKVNITASSRGKLTVPLDPFSHSMSIVAHVK